MQRKVENVHQRKKSKKEKKEGKESPETILETFPCFPSAVSISYLQSDTIFLECSIVQMVKLKTFKCFNVWIVKSSNLKS